MTLEKFSIYKNYLQWFRKSNPQMTPFTEEQFYKSSRYEPEEIFETNVMSQKQAYDLLGCEANMDDHEIKLAYHKKCMDFHPDKLASKELHPDFRKFANDQMTKLNEAYEIICDFRTRRCKA